MREKVRQRCGFGCVVCGLAVCHYDHFDPPFEDAREHRAEGITLLCGHHHDKKTRGLLSVEAVAEANGSPRAMQAGYSHDVFDTGPEQPTIVVGTVGFKCRDYAIAFETRGTPQVVVAAKPPEQPGGPFRLSALLRNKDGTEVLQIRENEWRASKSAWDVDVEGKRIVVRNAPRDVALVLRAESRTVFVIERLAMYRDGVLLTCDERRGLFLEEAGSWSARISNLGLENTAGGGVLISLGASSIARRGRGPLRDGDPLVIW